MRELTVLSKNIGGVEVLTTLSIFTTETLNLACRWDQRQEPAVLMVQYEKAADALSAYKKALKDSVANGWDILYKTNGSPKIG